MLKTICFLGCFVLVCSYLEAQDILKSSTYDSILNLRAVGADESKQLKERFKFAKRASELSYELETDSIILRSNRILSTVLLYSGDFEKFSALNHQLLKLAKKLNDSIEMGLSNHNIGWYYFQSRVQNDSAYYYLSKAIEIHRATGKVANQIDALENISKILMVEKDYLGSEGYAINALKLLDNLPKSQLNLGRAYRLYNLLGNVSQELNQYEASIDYHEKAMALAGQRDDGLLVGLFSKNNVAFSYRENGELKTALRLYQEVLDYKDLYELDPSFYALVLENTAYTRFLSGDKNYDTLERMFKRAYKLADSLEDPITKMATTIDMANFYQAQKKPDSSLRYATETYEIAKVTNDNTMRLESLMLLGALKPGIEGKKYLNEHIRISDSLLQHERGVRNKFARIMFETDKIEQEKERIATQRFWLLMISIALLVTLFMLYVIITQRAKNKVLQFEKEQQQTNEEIYNLMLSQQDKVDEARNQEKIRISEEIHDGILGRLFGTRLSLDTFNAKEGPEAANTRAQYINDLKDIEQDIRQISHDLNTDFVAGSGFREILKALIQNQTTAYQLDYEFYHNEDINWEYLSNKSKIHIYRILQETMQNIYKHANASHIKISFHLKNDVILLSIKDNGKGFVNNKSKKGIGIKNINSRVAEVNGTLKIDSEIEKGTTVAIQIPYTEK